MLLLASLFSLVGCGANNSQARIVRIGHNQTTNHPTHKGLVAFQKYIHDKLGDKYDIEIYPSELLGSQPNMIQLTQTGAIDICVASTATLDSFSKNYAIFNLPYLFANLDVYHKAMEDPEITEPIFESTKQAGFTTVTWLDAGARSFYTIDTPIYKPEDLKGLKIRVQQSPINVEMMKLLGGSATPLNFGEVYTALQAHIIDGAENNERALVDMGHGNICKYYSYDMHQMVPDLLIANNAFLDSLSSEDRRVFEEGFKIVNRVQREEWDKSIQEVINYAKNEQHVHFIHPETKPFMDACMPIHEEVLSKSPNLRPTYERIQKYNQDFYARTKGMTT